MEQRARPQGWENGATMQKIYASAQKMDAEELAEYYRCGHEMHWSTVGPKDCLYVPPGYIVLEQCLSLADVIGVRASVLVNRKLDPQAEPVLRQMHAESVAAGRTKLLFRFI